MLERHVIPSPCVSVCVMDPATGWCEGCLRTLAEIASWSGLPAEARATVMRSLPDRRKILADKRAPTEAGG